MYYNSLQLVLARVGWRVHTRKIISNFSVNFCGIQTIINQLTFSHLSRARISILFSVLPSSLGCDRYCVGPSGVNNPALTFRMVLSDTPRKSRASWALSTCHV